MKLKNVFLKSVLYLSLSAFLVSCNDSEDTRSELSLVKEGVFILNAGSMNKNNSNLSYYDFDTNILTSDIFNKQNEKGLGDTGQDLIVYGSKMYITVTGSNLIYKLNKQTTIVDQIAPLDGTAPRKPRSIVGYKGKLYVSLQDGNVARIDTTSFKIEAYAKVGAFPEQMTVVNNKLYVANSGLGEGTTLSVIDLNNFEAPAKTIEVALNPSNMASDSKGNVYFISLGNNQTIKNTLYKMDVNGKITAITNASQMVVSGSKIYLIYSGYTPNWTPEPAVFSWYDIETGKVHNERFVAEKDANGKAIDLNNASSISIDLASNIYITTSDYVSNGDIYIFSPIGNFTKKLDTGGLNPMGAYYVNNR